MGETNAYFVYGIKTDFMMSEQDKNIHDFYVNLGTGHGVKEGTMLDVYRTISTVDDLNKRVSKKISFRIAKLKVIHAEDGVSVARVEEMRPISETPIGEIPAVVVGDTVEVVKK